MLEECEKHLERTWNLQFKQGSTEFLVVWGSMDDELVSERWRKVDVFNSLGHRIEHTGSIQCCFSMTIAAAWRAFWANVGKPCFRSFSVSLKVSRILTLVQPIITFRMSRWPWTQTKAKHLDTIQKRMFQIALGLKPTPDESWSCSVRRRHTRVGEYLPSKKLWSAVWAQRVVNWQQHIDRNTNNACWSARLSNFRSPEELADRRVASSQNRPQVRIAPGFTSKRWSESVSDASDYIKTF